MKFNSNIKIKECRKFKDRLLGLMFKKNIDYGIKIPNCNSIHTFFMFNEIDIFMCDKDDNILYTYYNVKPFRIIWPKKNIKTIYEIPIKNR